MVLAADPGTSAPEALPLPPGVAAPIETPTQVPPRYDPGGELVPVYDARGNFSGYERPPGWQPSQAAQPGAKPQAGTTAPGAPAANPEFDPAVAAGLIKNPDGSYSRPGVGAAPPVAGPAPTPADGALNPAGGEPGKPGFDPALAAGLTKNPDGSYARPGVAPPPAVPVATSQLAPGQKTGMVANLGAGTNEAITGTLGLLPDMTTRLLNLIPQGVNAATGTQIPLIQHPFMGSDWWNHLFGNIGANPEDVVPQTEAQAMARGAARAVTAAALPGGIAKLLPEAAGTAEAVRSALAAGVKPMVVAGAAGGGALGQSFADMLPPDSPYRPLADLAGQLTGAGLVGAGEAGMRFVGNVLGGAKRIITGPTGGAPELMINPATGHPFQETVPLVPGGAGAPIAATPAVQRAAVAQVARNANLSPDQLSAALDAAPVPPVPGSVPSMGQRTGIMRLLGFERSLRMQPYGRLAAAEREAQNDVARTRALRGAERGDVGGVVGRWLRSKFNAEKAAAATDTEGLQRELDRLLADNNLTAADKGDVQVEGARMRGTIEAIRENARKAVQRVYDRIDPEGKARLDGTPVAKESERIAKDEVDYGSKLTADEAPIFEAASALHGVQPLKKLLGLQKSISQAQRDIRKAGGSESPPMRRLTILSKAVDDAIVSAAERATNAGNADDILGTMQDADAANRASGGVPGGAAAGGEAAAAGAGGEPAAGGPGGAAGDANAQPGAVPGRFAGDRAVAPGEARPLGRVRKPEDVIDFMMAKGGLRNSDELRARDAHLIYRPGKGSLIRKNGLSAHHMREELEQEGFLPYGSLDDDVHGLIDEYKTGRRVYRPADEAAAADFEAQREAQSLHDHYDQLYRAQIEDAQHEAGVRLSAAEVSHAAELMHNDPSLLPAHAVHEAAMAGEEAALESHARANAFGRPGMPQAEQDQLQLPASRVEAENMDPAVAADIKQARADWAIYKGTYREGDVGSVTAKGSGPGGWRIGDSAVPGRLFKKGPGGAEAADSLIKAAGSVQRAEEMLGDYPAMVLRGMAMKNGVFSLAGYQKFLATYGPALKRFPTIARKFEDVAGAQRAFEQAAARGAQRIEAFEKSTAAAYLGKDEWGVDPGRAIQRLLNSDNVGASFRDLAARVAGNPVATLGLRRDLLDHILNRSLGGEAGTTGDAAVKAAVFQKLIRDPKVRAAMDAVLTPEQIRIVDGVGDDLMWGQRAWNATKIPGSPASAADAYALQKKGGLSNIAAMFMGDNLGSFAAKLAQIHNPIISGAFEVAGMLGAEALRARRAAALEHVDKIVTEMVLNPEFGRFMLQNAPRSASSPLIAQLRQKLMAVSLGFGLPSQRTQ